MIGFPNLNIYFDVNPIAISIGKINIYWYGILIACAFAFSILMCCKQCRKYELKKDDVVSTILFSIFIGIIGARIYYVIFNLEYYLNNVNEILKIYNGGLAIYGGIIFGAITIYLCSKFIKFNFLDMLDLIAPYLALSQAIGRLGNFINIEAYGIETNTFLKMQIANGIYVHPTFLYEMLIDILLFILLSLNINRRKFKGEQLSIYLMIYGLGRFFIEKLRADSLMLFNYRVSCIVSIIFVIIGVYIIIMDTIKKENVK